MLSLMNILKLLLMKMVTQKMKGYAYEKREGLVAVNEWFSMMNIFTSKTKTKDLEKQMKNFFRLSWTFNHWANIPIPTGLNLSGTPLNEAFISLHQLIPHFKKRTIFKKFSVLF